MADISLSVFGNTPVLRARQAPARKSPKNASCGPEARFPARCPRLRRFVPHRAFMNVHEHVCAPAAFPASAPTPASVAVPFPPCAAASSPKLSGRRTGSCFVFLLFQ